MYVGLWRADFCYCLFVCWQWATSHGGDAQPSEHLPVDSVTPTSCRQDKDAQNLHMLMLNGQTLLRVLKRVKDAGVDVQRERRGAFRRDVKSQVFDDAKRVTGSGVSFSIAMTTQLIPFFHLQHVRATSSSVLGCTCASYCAGVRV